MKHLRLYENFDELNENAEMYHVKFTFDIYFTGEWYDGSSMEDGVPYVNGTASVELNGTNIGNTKEAQGDSSYEWSDIFSEAVELLDGKIPVENLELDYYDDHIEGVLDVVLDDSPDGRVFPMETLEFDVNVDNGKITSVTNPKATFDEAEE